MEIIQSVWYQSAAEWVHCDRNHHLHAQKYTLHRNVKHLHWESRQSLVNLNKYSSNSDAFAAK